MLGGALSYMMAEAFDWPEGLDKKFHQARGFYITLVVSLILGLGINFIGISPIKALIWTAVLYGLTAPVLIALLLHICNRRSIMGVFVNGRWITSRCGHTALMTASALAALFQFVARSLHQWSRKGAYFSAQTHCPR